MTEPLHEVLLDQAREAAGTAYAPYSDFHVGAVAVADDGRVFTGANVENSAYGATICAEANAISTAAAAGVRKIDAVAVACLDTGECYPCGNCRQVMREFNVERVIVQEPNGSYRVHTLTELLPHAFGPDQLSGGG
ncbi:MAG: cytidine deaminase [Acidimicrobiia bacterium]|nr:cytidine deaminase [Acidimicrobiia bacterium]